MVMMAAAFGQAPNPSSAKQSIGKVVSGLISVPKTWSEKVRGGRVGGGRGAGSTGHWEATRHMGLHRGMRWRGFV